MDIGMAMAILGISFIVGLVGGVIYSYKQKLFWFTN